MVIMYIVGIILLLVEWYLIKHTYSTRCKGCYNIERVKGWEPVKMPVWSVILAVLFTAVPYVGGISWAIIFFAVYFKYVCDPDVVIYDSEWHTYWRLRNSFLLKQI